MIKPDSWIVEFGLSGAITPFNPENVNPASYDLTLGSEFIKLLPHKRSANGRLEEKRLTADTVILNPGSVVLATSNERVTLPGDVCAELRLKSSRGREFIDHCFTGWIDCGFSGQITMQLKNVGPNQVRLDVGMRIAQLIFMQMERAADNPYGSKAGKYQGQTGPTSSK